MNTFLFRINKLVCAYNNGQPVLNIENLKIPHGKIIFLLGASGCGKSTLLETLGLMNNTMISGEISFQPTPESSIIPFSTAWQKEGENSVEDIRKKYFSFIFQQTNLMGNFTAYENICLSEMIKSNSPQSKANETAEILMNKIGLPESQVNQDTLAANLSGGQKQRVAFVRALNSSFSVLFGDEPTGNLDKRNGVEVMESIHSITEQNKTAIIVSHDIDLALHQADTIIVLTKSAEKGYGEVLAENIFQKEDWQNKIPEYATKIHQLYVSEGDYASSPSNKAEVTKNKTDKKTDITYQNLFSNKEYLALSGKNYSRFGVLTLMLSITLLAIGFANGSLHYLNVKMKNPFVNWLQIYIPYDKKGIVKDMTKTLKEANNKNKFDYKDVTSFAGNILYFRDSTRHDSYRARCRNFELGDPMLTELLQPENVVHGHNFLKSDDISVMVTQSFLENMHYPLDASHLYLEFSIHDSITKELVPVFIPIGIRAVVKFIPGRFQVATTPQFFQVYAQHISQNTFDVRKQKEIYFYLPTKDENKLKEFRKNVLDFFQNHPEYKTFRPDCDMPIANKESWAEGRSFRIWFSPLAMPNYLQLNNISAAILADKNIKDFSPLPLRSYWLDATIYDKKTIEPFILSIHFSDLNRVRNFSEYILKTFNKADDVAPIEVDETDVKEKENFNFISNILLTISFIILIFAAVSVCIFLSNLIQLHLSNVRMNLGTLKAFGLANETAESIYFKIIIKFISYATLLSCVLAFVIGSIINQVLIYVVHVEAGVSYFRLFDMNTFVTLVILGVASLVTARFAIRRMLSLTPGDLIYGR